MPSASLSVRSLSEVEKHLSSRLDRSGEGSSAGPPASMRRGSSENNLDRDPSAVASPSWELRRGRWSLDYLQQKILKVTERLKIEQTARDDNLAEYLQLLDGAADKQQAARIKQVFEKKNQKSAHNMAQMHKKLEQYQRRFKDEEVPPPPPPPQAAKHSTIPRESPRQLLRDMTGSGRHPTMDKIKTIGPGVSLSPPFFFSKPREFANLIRNKFGSADNIAHMKTPADADGPMPGKSASPVAKYPSDDECSSGSASNSADSNGAAGRPPEGDAHGGLEEARVIKDAQKQLRDDMDDMKARLKNHFDLIGQSLQEERYRYARLEDQVNDLTELHQHEMADLKQELASIEERVAYQAQERARDIQEALESCQTRVSKLELQQQQQQTAQLESGDARVLLGRSINIMLALITVVLVCVSTAAKFAAPLARSRQHLAATLLALGFIALLWKNWERLHFAIDRLLLPA